MTRERSLGALRTVAAFRRALDELEQLDRSRPDESEHVIALLERFCRGRRAERTN